jgi:type IV pilus assembly protein PilB
MQALLTNKTIEKLKYDLVREQHVSFDDLSKAEEIAKASHINLGQAMVNSGLISEHDLLEFIEAKLHIPFVDLNDYSLDKRCLKFISEQDARKYKVIPLFKIEEVLTVAMADPMDLFVINSIINSMNYRIEPIICSERLILQTIDEYYDSENIETMPQKIDEKENFDWRELLNSEYIDEKQAEDIIKAVLNQAVAENIHEVRFEQFSNGLNVIFKTDIGAVEKGIVPVLMVSMFITRLKSMSGLDYLVSEIPQLGKLTFKNNETILIASVSAFPTIKGERILLKIYKPPEKFETLSINPQKLKYIQACFEKSGIILVCGSEQSGKTSIIYSMLSSMSSKNKNIMTIESIVKYDIPEIHQCELNENIGFNLDKAMRFIEFQSPDTVYFEGINSKSGLEYFVSLAISGKLVITEFMTNDLNSLAEKFAHSEFNTFKKLITCLIFVHNKEKIDVLTRLDLEKLI